ncbi:MAG: AAA family ATPase [Candidatus Woesebacteria bacterium]|nr:AAA family ATPase [Candidatus Woesebacteria bacterium]
MQRILITGVSGTGKTTTCKALREMGYEAVDIENIKGMFEMVHKGTNKVFKDYDNANPDHLKNAEWICNVDKLKQRLNIQKEEIAFYSGIASNMDDILPLFEKFIVLYLTSEALNDRLRNREGTEDIGNNQEGRNVILGWKDWWETKMRNKGAIFIDASRPSKEIGIDILDKVTKNSSNIERHI